jgi:uncharacterized protein YndB with AHSA1/START domain
MSSQWKCPSCANVFTKDPALALLGTAKLGIGFSSKELNCPICKTKLDFQALLAGNYDVSEQEETFDSSIVSELINVPIESVWASLTDTLQWHEWWTGHELLLATPSWQKEAHLVFSAGMRAIILEFTPNSLLEFGNTHPAGFVVKRSFALNQEDDSTKISYGVKIEGATMFATARNEELQARTLLLKNLISHLSKSTKPISFFSKLLPKADNNRQQSVVGQKRDEALRQWEEILGNEDIHRKLSVLNSDSPQIKQQAQAFEQALGLTSDEAVNVMRAIAEAGVFGKEGITHYKKQVGTKNRIWFDAVGMAMELIPLKEGWLQGLEIQNNLEITKHRKDW